MHNLDRNLLEYEPEEEYYEAVAGEEEYTSETGGVFNEEEENEWAAELLAVSNEEELDQFLGGLIRGAGKAIGSFVRSPTGQALGGVLKGAAKKALPSIGSAVGGYFGGSTGSQIGGQLASAAGRIFGLEAEGLSPEDRDFEFARRFVRLAGSAVRNAASSDGEPEVVAAEAVAAAAQQHAPGLIASGGQSAPTSRPGARQSGRWIRRGSRIVLMGA